jgi:GNAT superfamily N-acetyltransferase
MEGLRVRDAGPDDLEELRALYARVVAGMDAAGVDIWSADYPWMAIRGDVAAGELRVAEKGGALLGACALNPAAANCDDAPWAEPDAPARYLGRLGVDPAHAREGVATALVEDAAQRALEAGARWLRLFVVDVNVPAIRFYEALGFARRSGIFQLDLGGELLHEYPYELGLSGVSFPEPGNPS